MCKLMWFAVLQIVLLFSMQISSTDEDTVSWNLHEKRIKRFTCRTPQLRSFQLKEIVVNTSELLYADRTVFPEMTALHRCDSQSGCCETSILHPQICGPAEKENVTLTFRTIIVVVRKKHSENEPTQKYVHVVATNHTKCSCQSPYDNPK